MLLFYKGQKKTQLLSMDLRLMKKEALFSFWQALFSAD